MIVVMLLMAATVADAQVSAALACPQVSVPGNGNGTGVVIGTKGDFAYLLTAAHVIGDFDAVDLILVAQQIPQARLASSQSRGAGTLARSGCRRYSVFSSMDIMSACCPWRGLAAAQGVSGEGEVCRRGKRSRCDASG